MTKANQLVARLSNYLEDPQRGGYTHYESRIADAEEENPGISAALRKAALELVNSSEGAVLLRQSAHYSACRTPGSVLQACRKSTHEGRTRGGETSALPGL